MTPTDEWLEYDSSGLYEYRPEVVTNFAVTMPELSREYRWRVAYIQKYMTADGKILWRCLTNQRSVFKSGFKTREECAQYVVKNCPEVVQRIAHRRKKLAQELSAEQPARMV